MHDPTNAGNFAADLPAFTGRFRWRKGLDVIGFHVVRIAFTGSSEPTCGRQVRIFRIIELENCGFHREGAKV